MKARAKEKKKWIISGSLRNSAVQTDRSATSCTPTSGLDSAGGSLPLLCTPVTLPQSRDYDNALLSETIAKHYHSKLALDHVTNHKSTNNIFHLDSVNSSCIFFSLFFSLVRFFGTKMKGRLRENEVLFQTPTTPEYAPTKSSYLLNLFLSPIKDRDLQSRN